MDVDSGYVEVCISGSYSGVCAVDWSDQDAQVVCRQLGKTVEGSVSIWDNTWTVPAMNTVTEFLCEGNETHLVECGFSQLPFGCTTVSGGVRCGRKFFCSQNVFFVFVFILVIDERASSAQSVYYMHC